MGTFEAAVGFEPTFSAPITLIGLEDRCGYAAIILLRFISNIST